MKNNFFSHVITGVVMLTVGLVGNHFFLNKPNQNIVVNPENSTDTTVEDIKTISKDNFSYFCENSANQSSIKIQTPRGNPTLFLLKTNDFDASGWTKEKRCNQIATKLERFNNQGTLDNLKTSDINIDGTIYPVICVPDMKEGYCTQEQVLVTLLPGKDANEILVALTNNPDSINVSTSYFSYDQKGNLILNLESFVNNHLSIK